MTDQRSRNRYIFVRDGRGSVYQVINEDTRAIVNRYEYDDFGNIVEQSGTLENPFTYTSREWEPELGMYYYRARWYDPSIGRFISEDPIGFAGGVNLYNYVEGNPINRIDPFGLDWLLYDLSDQMVYAYPGDIPGDYNVAGPPLMQEGISGPHDNGALPTGNYNLTGKPSLVPVSHPHQSSYCDANGNCWWQPIESETPNGRSGLGIHPDGNIHGTAGCVGLTSGNTSGFYNYLRTSDVDTLIVQR
jgi:RHS repeat-associated protein